ncbi:MAG: glutathione S-transferase family protein [Gammaproteobacteria bacterium]
MIKLFQFPSFWHLPNPSPFCMKLETYLRMTNQPFEIVKIVDVRKTPKGKLPYIQDNDKIISDTSFIIDYLKKTYGDNLDNQLTDQQKAEALSIQRLVEEHLYWVMVYSRWIDNRNWPTLKKTFFGKMPPVLKSIIPYLVRKKVKRVLAAQGIGRHSEADIYALGIQDINALSVLLNNQPFFLGNQPTSLDASTFAFLLSILKAPIESPLKAHLEARQNLVAYCGRMWEKYYNASR